MLKAFKKISSEYAGKQFATLDYSIDEDECGEWYYLVVDVAGIRPRDDSCYNKEYKRTDLDKIKEGTVVRVDRRKRSGWTKWLSLDSARSSWVFDVSPKDKKVRMVEVEVLAGDWTYQVCHDRVPLLPKPSMYLASLKSQKKNEILQDRDIFVVKEKVRPLNGKGSFLKLGDGRGWVLDFANGRQLVQRWDSSQEGITSSSCVQLLPQGLGEPEAGQWDYIVLDPKGICVRSSPTYDRSCKLQQQKLAEGELVHVIERRAGDGTTFLHAENRGWVFDVQPGSNNRRQRLAEVNKEYGMWYYRVVATQGVALRSRCTLCVHAKIDYGPKEGELVPMSCRIKVGNTTFLQPKGESGWIFDKKDGKTIVEGPIVVDLPLNTIAKIRAEGAYLRSAPCFLSWAATKKLLLLGTQAQVTHMCTLGDTRWLRVRMQNGSMDGWVTSDYVDLQQEAFSTQRPAFDAQQVRAALEAPNPRAVPWA
mmetsp:Transcript_91689/g.145007  ORF Transcript_91689/g.145007 Transcript_91689/m.145007 type:complete len:477 (-) Transcript_91689:136-1566(-)